MHTVLIAMNDDAGDEQREQVRTQLLTALPDLQLTFAHTLEDALRAPPPTVVITFGYPWLPDLVRERESIEWIHLLSAGADRLLQQDLPFERLRISTSSGVHAATIGDYVMAGVLYHTKHLARFAAQQRERRWERGPQEELEGRTMAILGYGAIGGHVVDEHAMLAALRDGRLRAATLDVFADEPLPADSPLWDRDDVLITPHVAGDTPAYMRKATDVFVENYVTWQREGRLTTEVDVARGY